MLRGVLRLLPLVLGLAGTVPAAAQVTLHLTFDNAGNLSADSSGNNYATSGSQGTLSQASGVSGGAAVFDGNSFLKWGTPVASTLAGSFSVSVWLKSTQTYGSNSSAAYYGAGIVYADQPGQTTDTIPIALNGNVAGFMTSDGTTDTTIHSTSSISTGSFVHVVATYNSANGAKRIYINGVLEASETVVPTTHNARGLLVLGANDFDSRYFSGQLDDFQFYSIALNATEVTYLYNNPGLTVPEPATWLSLAAGLAVLAAIRRRSASPGKRDS